MRTKLFINFPVLSFTEKMQIDVAHDRTVLICIPHELFRPVQFYDIEMVRNPALRAGYRSAKETLRVATLRSDRFVRFSIQHDLNGLRVRTKDPDLHVVANFVGT